MSPRLLCLHSDKRTPSYACDWLDAQAAAARLPGRRWPRCARTDLLVL
jgi:hypothetical protein